MRFRNRTRATRAFVSLCVIFFFPRKSGVENCGSFQVAHAAVGGRGRRSSRVGVEGGPRHSFARESGRGCWRPARYVEVRETTWISDSTTGAQKRMKRGLVAFFTTHIHRPIRSPASRENREGRRWRRQSASRSRPTPSSAPRKRPARSTSNGSSRTASQRF